jgi:hypothetical protein
LKLGQAMLCQAEHHLHLPGVLVLLPEHCGPTWSSPQPQGQENQSRETHCPEQEPEVLVLLLGFAVTRRAQQHRSAALAAPESSPCQIVLQPEW